MPYPGTMTTLFAAARIAAASSAVALRTGLASVVPATAACSCPNAPNRTFENERFIAFDMFMERMNPDAPSSAPATISNLLEDEAHCRGRKSRVGIEERNYSRHVGAADRNNHHYAEEKWNRD